MLLVSEVSRKKEPAKIPILRYFDLARRSKTKMQTDQLWPINDDDGAAELCACISRLESRDGEGA